MCRKSLGGPDGPNSVYRMFTPGTIGAVTVPSGVPSGIGNSNGGRISPPVAPVVDTVIRSKSEGAPAWASAVFATTSRQTPTNKAAIVARPTTRILISLSFEPKGPVAVRPDELPNAMRLRTHRNYVGVDKRGTIPSSDGKMASGPPPI